MFFLVLKGESPPPSNDVVPEGEVVPSEAVFKSVNEDERLVYAEVYAPNRPDSDGEFMDEEGVKQACFTFMKSMKLDSIDSYHNNTLVEGCCVVESFIARKGDPDFIEGAWVVGVHIDNDDMWEKIKKGEINGFSMEALVQRDVVDVTMEIPPILSGRTMKSEQSDDDHTHSFTVAYNEDGKFLGGKTDAVNGHYHIIKRGTVTETSSGHRHKFDFIEEVIITE